MELRPLGRTGIKVSRLCFGALTVGPLQCRLPLREGAFVIREALEGGVNFIDTAQMYGTYPYIREALKGFVQEVVISSKSYAYGRQEMQRAVEEARREIDRDVIDIFMLHEQESELTIRGHQAALDFLLECRSRGVIRAVGLSTHAVRGVIAAASTPGIDVVHPLINLSGIGIVGGTREDMERAINTAKKAGLGVYGMKPLGGGNLLNQAWEALQYAFGLADLDAVAVGMKSAAEVKANIALAKGDFDEKWWREVEAGRNRRLHVDEWCRGCGRCVEVCPQQALLQTREGEPVQVMHEKCVLCGYCGSACENFCIRII